MEEYDIGKKVWMHNGGIDNPLVQGIIVHKFLHYGRWEYVIEIPTHIEPILVVRDYWTISEDGKSINFYKKRNHVKPGDILVV